MAEGRFTIPTYIYLTTEQRRKLEALVLQKETDLSELLTCLVADYLEHQPTPEPVPVVEDKPDVSDLQRRRGELRRLRARVAASDDPPPDWLAQYMADLEQQVQQLERSIGA